jgi:hypothetical protein
MFSEKAVGKPAFGANEKQSEAIPPAAFHLRSSLRNFRTT